MKEKIRIIIGSNSRIIKETALANMGATVVMVVQNSERGQAAEKPSIVRQGKVQPV